MDAIVCHGNTVFPWSGSRGVFGSGHASWNYPTRWPAERDWPNAGMGKRGNRRVLRLGAAHDHKIVIEPFDCLVVEAEPPLKRDPPIKSRRRLVERYALRRARSTTTRRRSRQTRRGPPPSKSTMGQLDRPLGRICDGGGIFFTLVRSLQFFASAPARPDFIGRLVASHNCARRRRIHRRAYTSWSQAAVGRLAVQDRAPIWAVVPVAIAAAVCRVSIAPAPWCHQKDFEQDPRRQTPRGTKADTPPPLCPTTEGSTQRSGGALPRQRWRLKRSFSPVCLPRPRVRICLCGLLPPLI